MVKVVAMVLLSDLLGVLQIVHVLKYVCVDTTTCVEK